MCGIAGVYLRDPSAKADLDGMLSTMLDEIEHRGGDATGFVAFGEEGVTEWQKAACDSKDFGKYRRPVPEGTRTILAHTRWATQGLPAFVENNHPLKRGSFFVIHNGHVSNDHKLFELAGRKRYGQVDSEAIPARFASLGKLAAAPKVMAEIEGAAAIAAVDENRPSELVLARGYSSPLFVLVTKRYVLWGSTPNTVTEAYEKHIGRLPKKAKVQNVAQGVVLHFVDGQLKKSKFKAYKPLVTKVTTPITFAWSDSSTEVGSKSWLRQEMEEDLETIECDVCLESVPWKEIDWQYDADAKMTWRLCLNCIGESPELLYEGDDLAKVNSFVLSDDDAE